MATAVGDLVVNLAANTRQYKSGMDRAIAINRNSVKSMFELGDATNRSQVINRKSVRSMFEFGRAARKQKEEVESLSNSVSRSGNVINKHTGSSTRGVRGILELSRGAEDAAVSFGLNGFQGAMRGSLNNITQFAMIAGGPALGAMAGFAAAGVAMIPIFFKLGNGAKEAAKKIKEAADELERFNKAQKDRIENRPARAAILDFQAKGKGPAERFKLRRNELKKEQEKFVGIKAKAELEIVRLTADSNIAARKARGAVEKPFGDLDIFTEPIFQKRRNEASAKARSPISAEIRQQRELIIEQQRAVKDARRKVFDVGPVAALKPAIDPAIQKAIDAFDKLALSVKSPFAQAREELKRFEKQVDQFALKAGIPQAKRDRLKDALRKQFQDKFGGPVAATKPSLFTKEQLKAADRIKQSIKTPIQKLADELNVAKRLRKSGLLKQGQFDKFATQLGQRADALNPKARPAAGPAAGPLSAGAKLKGSAEAFSAINKASLGARDPEEKTAKNTGKIVKSNAQIAQEMAEIKRVLKSGNVNFVGID